MFFYRLDKYKNSKERAELEKFIQKAKAKGEKEAEVNIQHCAHLNSEDLGMLSITAKSFKTRILLGSAIQPNFIVKSLFQNVDSVELVEADDVKF